MCPGTCISIDREPDLFNNVATVAYPRAHPGFAARGHGCPVPDQLHEDTALMNVGLHRESKEVPAPVAPEIVICLRIFILQSAFIA
jgi:hypothetical protein